MKNSSKKGGLIKGLIIGGAIASVTSLLLNSKKGKAFREKMSDDLSSSKKKLWQCWKNRGKK